MNEEIYKKLDLEVALPMGADTSSFFKIDGFVTKS